MVDRHVLPYGYIIVVLTLSLKQPFSIKPIDSFKLLNSNGDEAQKVARFYLGAVILGLLYFESLSGFVAVSLKWYLI